MSGPADRLGVAEVAARVVACVEAGGRAVLCTAVSPEELAGARILLTLSPHAPVPAPGQSPLPPGAEISGTFGSSDVDAAVGDQAKVAAAGAPGGLMVVPGPHGEIEYFVEVHHPTPELLIVGAGHIARPLATLGTLLGFEVTVVDDRPDFATRERFPGATRVVRVDFTDPFRDVPIGPHTHVVLVTRGHRYDYECLRHVLRMEARPAYLGMIGSRRRVRATFAKLLDEGIDRARIESVRAPIGLDLGGQTPAEIALSVAAEIVCLARGGSAVPLHDRARVLERFFDAAPSTETSER